MRGAQNKADPLNGGSMQGPGVPVPRCQKDILWMDEILHQFEKALLGGSHQSWVA